VYLQSEIASILRFKEMLEKSTGRRLSANAAAAMWVERYAASYRSQMSPDCGGVRQGQMQTQCL
jgi:hypothetical protein